MDSILTWVSHYGYGALFLLLVLGIVGLPIPDETLLVFSGYLTSTGRFHPALIFASGFFGSASGISISYLLGKAFGYTLVERYGKFFHLSPQRMEQVNRWFHRIGDWLLTIGYFIPGVRHFTALVAGMSNLEYRTFAAFAYPGAAVWVGTFLGIGYFVGEAWPQTFASIHKYVLAIVLGGCVVAALVWFLRRERKPAD